MNLKIIKLAELVLVLLGFVSQKTLKFYALRLKVIKVYEALCSLGKEFKKKLLSIRIL